MLGIEIYGMTGPTKGGDHMWNLMKLENKWVMTDTTFMDPIYYNDDYVRENVLDKSYFAITLDELLKLDTERSLSEDSIRLLDSLNINH